MTLLCLPKFSLLCLTVVAIQGKSFIVKRSISNSSGNEVHNNKNIPIISSFHINSIIEFRYARTTVESHVKNPSSRSQEATFTVTIPNSAFISNFSMIAGGEEHVGNVMSKDEAKKVYKEAIADGKGAGLVVQDVKYSNKFMVSANVEAQDVLVFKLTYEELLQRKLGWYEHVVNVNPGQIVKNFSIVVNIDESLPLSKLIVTDFKQFNDIDIESKFENKIVQVEWEKGNATARINFKPNIVEQEKYGENREHGQGLAGQLLVKYDVDRNGKDNEIQVIDDYFVHFFTPDIKNLITQPKHLVFVLDISGSMYPDKIMQVKDAMFSILDDMTDQDYFNIITFSHFVYNWQLTAKDQPIRVQTNQNSFELIQATAENKRDAINYVNSINAMGGTNINKALLEGIKYATEAKNNESLPTNLKSIIAFLSDGDATAGIINVDDIKNNIKIANIQARVPIYSLGFGKGADFNLIRDISTDSEAFAKHIYEDYDAALYLEDFLAVISNPLLSNVQFNYIGDLVDNDSLSETHLSTFYKGSEFVVTGKLQQMPKEDDTLEVTVNAAGTAYNHKASICFKSNSQPKDDNIMGNTYISNNDQLQRNCSLTHTSSSSHAPNILRNLHAYLNIKQLLKRSHVNGINPLGEKALNLSLSNNFVTDLTSLVVTKYDEVDVKESHEEEVNQDEENSKKFIASQSYFDYDNYDLPDHDQDYDYDNPPDLIGNRNTTKIPSCSLTMFAKTYYRGQNITTTEDIPDLGVLDFDDKVVSIRVNGNCSWRLFTLVDYQGEYDEFSEGEYRSPLNIGKIFREASSVSIEKAMDNVQWSPKDNDLAISFDSGDGMSLISRLLNVDDIPIKTYHVSCQSDSFDGVSNYTGMVLYQKNGRNSWTQNGIHIKPGYIYFVKSSKLSGMSGPMHSRAYQHLFGGAPPSNGLVASEFSHYQGRFQKESSFDRLMDDEEFEQVKNAIKSWSCTGQQNYRPKQLCRIIRSTWGNCSPNSHCVPFRKIDYLASGYGITFCSERFIIGDNFANDVFIQADEYMSTCIDTCKCLHPSGTGVTESVTQKYTSGRGKNKNKCWCEFGEPKFIAKSVQYQTCLFDEGMVLNKTIYCSGV